MDLDSTLPKPSRATLAFAKTAVRARLRTSPANRSSVTLTVALVFVSYTLSTPLRFTVNARVVMLWAAVSGVSV